MTAKPITKAVSWRCHEERCGSGEMKESGDERYLLCGRCGEHVLLPSNLLLVQPKGVVHEAAHV